MNWSGSDAARPGAVTAEGGSAALFLDEVGAIVRAVRIESETRFEFAGQTVDLTAPGRATPPLQPHDHPLVEQLLSLLYERVYCRRFHGAIEPDPPFVEDDGRLAAALSAANAGGERMDRGWLTEVVLPSGAVVARKGTVARTFLPGEFVIPGQRGRPVTPGAPLQAALAHESWTLLPGYYFAFGGNVGDDQDDRVLVRFYWNVDHPHAGGLLHAVTEAFNRFEVPFRLKCPAHPAAYGRCEPMVLYLSRRHSTVGMDLCRRIHAELGRQLREETPIFTRRLGRGLAFAEDPGGAESFGTQRMRLLAEGLWQAFLRRAATEEDRLSVVAEHFETNGASTAEPWRCRADGYRYDFTGFDSPTEGAA